MQGGGNSICIFRGDNPALPHGLLDLFLKFFTFHKGRGHQGLEKEQNPKGSERATDPFKKAHVGGLKPKGSRRWKTRHSVVCGGESAERTPADSQSRVSSGQRNTHRSLKGSRAI